MIATIICENCKTPRTVVTSGNFYQCTKCGNIYNVPEGTIDHDEKKA